MARLSREESRVRTRELLLASAAAAFARSGYAGASVDDIAEEAGFSKGAFYSNFASKEAIFLALLEEKKRAEIASIRAMLAETETAKLMATLTAWLDSAHSNPQLALLSAELELQARRSASLAAGYEQLQAGFRAELAAFIAMVFERLGLAPPAPIADIAQTFIAISNGSALTAGQDSGSAGRAMRLFLDMVIKASAPAVGAGERDPA